MEKMVLAKSLLRRPIRMLLCMVLLGLSIAAFLSNVFACLLVNRQMEECASRYQQIGELNVIGTENSMGDALDKEAIAQLEQSQYVSFTNHLTAYRAVIPEVLTPEAGYFGWQGVGTIYMQGVVLDKEREAYDPRNDITEYADEECNELVTVDYKRTDQLTIQYTGEISGNTKFTNLMSQVPVRVLWKEGEEAEADAFLDGVEIGQEYFFKLENDIGGYVLRPLEGLDMLMYPIESEAEPDLTQPMFDGVRTAIERLEADLHMYMMQASQDMSALPGMQTDYYIRQGRYLSSADSAEKNPVCVIWDGLAAARKVRVGDTITVTIGDNCIDRRQYRVLALQDETRWAQWEEADKVTLTLEVVGMLSGVDELHSVMSSKTEIYIPESLIPENWESGTEGFAPTETNFNFGLTSPADTERFLAENEEVLKAAGIEVSFVDNGWDGFVSAAAELKSGWRFGMVIFGFVALVMMGLTLLIWLFSCRKERAVLRALGVPARSVRRQMNGVIGVMAAAAIMAAGVISYRYALDTADRALTGLKLYTPGTLRLELWQPAAISAAILVLFLILLLAFERRLSDISVLEQLQGSQSRQKKAKKERNTGWAGKRGAAAAVERESETETETAPKEGPQPQTAVGSERKRRKETVYQGVFRYIAHRFVRLGGRSAAAVLLPAFFLLAIGWIEGSIANNRQTISRLYENTTVRATFIINDSPEVVTLSPKYLMSSIFWELEDSGYITEANVEALMYGSLVSDGQSMDQLEVRGISSLEGHQEIWQSGAGSIEWLAGYSADYFEQEYESALDFAKAPGVVLSERAAAAAGVQAGDYLDEFALESGFSYEHVQVIGILKGAGMTGDVLVPRDLLEHQVEGSLDMVFYNKMYFTIHPQWNSQLDEVVRKIGARLNYRDATMNTELEVVLFDDELQDSVKPLEKAIRLLEVLKPFVVVIFLLCTAGAAALFTMLARMELAVMKSLGTPGKRIVLCVCGERLVGSLAGVGLGALAAWLFTGGFQANALLLLVFGTALVLVPLLAAGTVTWAVGKRSPLEYMQVKE